ncbi:MAG: 4Fe-4S binding protein [Verrucomicrobiae bacterium]|nr:4Fe-4S binding protein [Verrucomicrobiae bacterium]
MRQHIVRILVCVALLGAPAASFGIERFPPPEFESGYKMPPTTAPAPRAEWLGWLDVAVLAGALALASYLALKKRSRDGILALGVFSLLYFGFYRKGCVCAIGSIQDVTLALFNGNYAVPLTVVAFFLLPILFTLFFGRAFCGAVCPMGAFQDLMALRPVKVPSWLEHALSVVPFVYLGLAVLFAATGSAFIICQWDPFVALYRRSGSAGMLALGAAFLIVGVFVGRPYCRFLCPYGAVLNLVSRFSKWNVELSPDDCNRCHICDVACPYGAIAEPAAGAGAGPAPKHWMRLAALALVLPLLVAGGAWLGHRLSVPFSRMHFTVSLAERIAAEDAGKVRGETEESQAFRQTGKPTEELYSDALRVRGWFATGGWWFGAFVGLVLGAKLISLWRPQRRLIYEPDPARCVACGRCYVYCPKELVRLKRLQKANIIPLTQGAVNR